MVVIAITRNGEGDAWKFASREAADEHPLIQYGDVILAGPEDILKSYSRYDAPRLCRFIAEPILANRVRPTLEMHALRGTRDSRLLAEGVASDLWGHLVQSAKVPLSDPVAILNQIVADRRKSKTDRREYRVMTENADNTANTQNADAPPATTATATRAPRASALPDNSVITLLSDKDGKKFGPENNPKRGGAAIRFAKYVDGMTVKQAVEAGITQADVRWDEGKGFIKVTAVAPAETAPDEKAPADSAAA